MVVMIGGGMIMMTDWINEVKAAIMAYYPGQEGGNAIAEVILGDINPSGKLPYVIPVSVNDLPKVDWFADDQYYEYYHGYTRLEKLGIAPLYPYGYGLSYTTFAFSDILAKVEEKSLITSCKGEKYRRQRRNRGSTIIHWVQNSKIDRPVKQLRGFKRITLKPGEERSVQIECPLDKLCWYNPISRKWELEPMEYEIYLGNSSADKEFNTDNTFYSRIKGGVRCFQN